MEENKEMMNPAAADSAPETTPAPDSKKKQQPKKVKKQPTPPPEPTEDDDEPEIPKSKRIFNTIVNVVLIIAIVIAATCTYIGFMSSEGNGVPSFFGICLMTVESESMEPTINKGDLIIGKAFPNGGTKRHEAALELRQGDIITYQTIIDGVPALNTHRIFNIGDGGEHVYFETKGDNNDYSDPATVHENSLEAKYLFRIPAVGSFVKFVQKPLGFFIVVIIPVLLFFIYHLVQFFRVLFEYQNVKMLIKYEQERGRTEDLIESQIKDQKTKEEVRRAAMEAELREQLRREMLAEMQAQKEAEAAAAAQSDVSDNTESNNSEQ